MSTFVGGSRLSWVVRIHALCVRNVSVLYLLYVALQLQLAAVVLIRLVNAERVGFLVLQ